MAATGVVAAAIAAFLPALSPDFVNWDDPGVLLDNPHYRGLGPRHLVWMFTTGDHVERPPEVVATGPTEGSLRAPGGAPGTAPSSS